MYLSCESKLLKTIRLQIYFFYHIVADEFGFIVFVSVSSKVVITFHLTGCAFWRNVYRFIMDNYSTVVKAISSNNSLILLGWQK